MPLGAGDPHDRGGPPPGHARGDGRRDRGGQPRAAPRRAAALAGADIRRRPRGEPRAAVVEEEARRIALAIAAVAPVLDPELVILGGGIGGNGDLLLDPIERELAALSPFRPRIAIGELGEDGGAARGGRDRARGGSGQLFSRVPNGTGGRSSYETSEGDEGIRNEISWRRSARMLVLRSARLIAARRTAAAAAARGRQRPGQPGQDAGHADAVASVDRRREEDLRRRRWTVRDAVPVDHRESRSAGRTRDTFDQQVDQDDQGAVTRRTRVLSFGPDYVGPVLRRSGLMQDMSNYMERDGVSDRPIRAGRDHLHQLRRQAVHAAVADRLVRPLLQQGRCSRSAASPGRPRP